VVAVWLSGNTLVSINEVALRWALLVLEWVTMSGVQLLMQENLSQYITSHSHPDQLNQAIPPWVPTKRALMLCGWEVKAGMGSCVSGRLNCVISLLSQVISERFISVFISYEALNKCLFTLLALLAPQFAPVTGLVNWC